DGNLVSFDRSNHTIPRNVPAAGPPSPAHTAAELGRPQALNPFPRARSNDENAVSLFKTVGLPQTETDGADRDVVVNAPVCIRAPLQIVASHDPDQRAPIQTRRHQGGVVLSHPLPSQDHSRIADD